METTQLNGIGIKTSRIALGTWAIRSWMWGETDEGESIRTIHAAPADEIRLPKRSEPNSWRLPPEKTA